jgi:hypothetical protein
MGSTRWEKWATLTGIGFVASLLTAYLIAPQPPKLSDTAATLADYFVKNQAPILAGTVAAAGLGGVLFLWWLGSLRVFLRRHETDGGRLSAVALASGSVTLLILMTYLAVRASLAFGLSGAVDPSVSRAFYAFAYTLDALNVFPVGALIVAASVSAMRSKAFPTWLVWLGLLVGITRWVTGLDVVLKESVLGDEGAIGFIAFLAVMAWIVLASVVMFRRTTVNE